MKKIIFLLFLLFYYLPIKAIPIDTLTTNLFVYSLEEQWLVYDKTSKTYLPYFPNIYGTVNKLHVDIGKETYKSLYLNILGDSSATIFLNQRLSYIFPKRQWLNLSIDSLQNNSKDNILLLTYYQQNNIEKLPESYISISPYLKIESSTTAKLNSNIIKHNKSNFRQNIIGIIALIVLFVVAIICSVHTPLFKWSLIWKNFTNFLQARTQAKRLQGLQFFWYTVFYSITLAFIAIIASSNMTNIFAQNFNFSSSSLISKNIFNFFTLFLILSASILLKYLVVAGIGSLYFNRQSLNLHWQEYITISQIICSFILLLGLFIACLPVYFTSAMVFLKYATLILLALQTVLISYRLRQSMSYKTVYFFGYLFSTEFVPFLLYANFFISL
jgi:hypothetical protein